MRKVFSLIFVCIMGIMSLSGCTDSPQKTGTEHYVYDILNMEKIPVGLWVTPPTNKINEQTYREMREMGINMVNGFGYNEKTDEEITAVLDLCKKLDMKFLLNQLKSEQNIRAYKDSGNKELIEQVMTDIAPYAKHEAYAGQIFIDEPGASLFDSIKAFADEYKKLYSGKQWYVNMFPSYAPGGIQASTYEEYIDTWLEKLNPSYLSYDSYPLIEFDSSVPSYRAEMADFYYNLDLLRAKTLDKGIPLWSFIATGGYKHPTEPTRRTPSREDLRWQVFSNLAFGVKGLQYFCYWTPTGDSYGDMLVTRSGVKTERYDYAKEVNAEFQMYGKFLLNANAEGVILKDYRRNGYELYSANLTNFGDITSTEGNLHLVGCFSDKDTGAKSVLITPTTPRDGINVTLNIKKGVKTVKAFIKGKQQTLQVQDGKIVLDIDAGDAVYIQF